MNEMLKKEEVLLNDIFLRKSRGENTGFIQLRTHCVHNWTGHNIAC